MRALLTTCALLAALTSGCKRTDIVGALGCAKASDCSPPDTICSTDGRCVPGCVANPALCVGGSTCNSVTGECSGNGIGAACSNDTNCDPPDVVCRVATGTCQAGCTVSAVCASDEVCNTASGHCCTPGSAGCPMRPPPTSSCNSDADCPDPPHNICSGGICVPGCATGGLCALPLVCNPTSGHCQPSTLCARDMDCDNGSYCTQAGDCVVLANGGATPCAGGTTVSYTCATKTTPADFKTCVGAPGPGGCPYCIDGSCMHPGLCSVADDCHGGDGCVGGLCRALNQPCPSLVNLADVVSGVYAAGKEVCVKGTVTATRSGYDGMLEIKLNSSPYLFVDIEPMYGLTLPQVNQTVTIHGTVRWDGGHMDRELLPVDWLAVVN
jgi:hypothetical protein